MKAVAIEGLGDPSVLRVMDVADPDAASPDKIIVRTEATSYNNIDALLRMEDFGAEFPIVPGSDLVGIATSGEFEGSRVLVNPGIPCGSCPGCATGQDCAYVRILGVHCWGSYGSYVSVPAKQCYPVPAGIGLEVAAAFPLAFLTSWRLLKTRAKLAPGESVLVWGATGGLGSSAISVAKSLGGRVLAVTRRESARARLLDHGADSVVNVTTQDLSAEVAGFTDDRGIDVVFEGPGSATWDRSMTVVAQGGRVVTAGVTSGNTATLDIEDLYYKQVSIIGSRMGYDWEFEEVLSALEQGKVQPLISSVRRLSEAREVHESVSSGGECGKVVMINDL